MTVAIDIEQFCRDPYASGIQRVVQQLAVHWPEDVEARFVVPSWEGRFALLGPDRAALLLSIPFTSHEGSEEGYDPNHGLRLRVHHALEEIARDPEIEKATPDELLARHDAWLLPEVSYLPAVLDRLEIARRTMPTTMIGYDALPMTEPANYRFVPGAGSRASEYFRLLASVDRVACISEWSRGQILERLRRSPGLVTEVAHPGGDHVPVDQPADRRPGPVRLLRVGTMEARKQPLEILAAFLRAVASGVSAELTFIGNPNSSDDRINETVRAAIDAGHPVRWIVGATDADVTALIRDADWFLSYGVEGYGIPVLESLRLGTGVLFDGIQPAAELVRGGGAVRLPLDELGQGIPHVTAIIAPWALPRWSVFARLVGRLAHERRRTASR